MSTIFIPGFYSLSTASNGYPLMFVNQSAVPPGVTQDPAPSSGPGQSGGGPGVPTGEPSNPSTGGPGRAAIQGPARGKLSF